MHIQIIVDSSVAYEAIIGDLQTARLNFNYHHIDSQDAFLASLTAPPHLILCARQLSNFSAQEALTILHKNHYDIPLIVLGQADDSEAHIVPLIKQGAVDYVVPQRQQRLIERISAILDSAAKLQSGQYMMQTHQEQHEVITFSIRRDGTVTYICGRGVESFGHTAEDFIHENVFDLCEHLPDVYNVMESALNGERPSCIAEIKDTAWEIKCRPAYNAAGEFIGTTGIAIDVSNTVMTWDALSKSEQRFNTIFQITPLAMLVVEMGSGKIINANHSAYTLFKQDTLNDERFMELPILNQSEEHKKLTSKIITRGDLPQHEITLTLSPKEHRNVIISASKIDLLGRLCALVAMQDMTDHYQALHDLEDSEKKLRSIFEDSTDVILIVNGQTGIVEAANHAVLHILGYTVDWIVGQHFSVLFPEQAHYGDAEILDDLNNYGAIFESQMFVHGNGSLVPMDLTATMIDWGKSKAILATFRDVSDREAAQIALQEVTQRLQTVISNAPVILYAFDAKGFLTLSEGKGLEAIGLKPGEIVGRSVFEVYQDYPDIIEANRRVLNGETLRAIFKVEETILDVYHVPLRNRQGTVTGSIGVAIDVTERERAQQELTKAEKIRAEIEKDIEVLNIKQGFTQMMTHEFRTPLTVIKSSAGALVEYADRLTPEKRLHHLKKIMHEVDNMNNLMEDILLISAAQEGKLQYSGLKLDLLRLATEIIEQFGLMDDTRRKHDFTFIHSDDFSELVMDIRFARYIITNLLNNAIKYTPTGGSITFRLTRDGDTILIEVSDTGIGIPEEDQADLFELFYRASNVAMIQGTGLGLPLVKYCVDAHDGEISLQSEVEKGSTFTVRLPAFKTE